MGIAYRATAVSPVNAVWGNGRDKGIVGVTAVVATTVRTVRVTKVYGGAIVIEIAFFNAAGAIADAL